MKNNIDIINKLNEANVIDFNDAKNKQRNKDLDKLNPQSEIESISIVQALDSIMTNAKEALFKIEEKGIYERKYLEDLISINEELKTLYKDMFKEE